MKIVVVRYEPETIFEDDIESMDVFDPAYFDTSDYKTYDLLPCLKLVKLIKADLCAIETVAGRR